MKIGQFSLIASTVVMLFGAVSVARADSAAATCQVRKDGETKQGASGPCTFSQRQGNIYLDLRNGDTYSLTPTGNQNQYRDQKGIKVVRTLTGGSTEEFRWEGGKRILLTFNGGAGSGGSSPSGSGGGESSVSGLQDLVGVRASSGEAELRSRGYTWVRAEQSGGDAYAYWRNNRSGQCVVVRTSDGRYASIAPGMETSCQQGAASGGGSTAERQDPFDTVCGVMTGGKDYSYRCGATDFYSGGRKVRTELRYPDQTIQLTWQSGNQVSVQFEGMAPRAARYSTSEGETNWVSEGKTYYYFSDKGRAQSEFQKFRD
jgi:hypothetical protein